MRFDENQIRKTIATMKPNGEAFEIRIAYKDKSIYSGYFNDAESLVNEIKKLPQGECNAYITLNDLNNACMSRSQAMVFKKANKQTTTSDNDITGYAWLLIDLDPNRPADTSSSDEEMLKAKEKCIKVSDFMKQVGFNMPLLAKSGNGYHLLYKVSLKKSDDNKQLIKRCLETLDLFFSDDCIKIDTSVFNPSRVCKLYGTYAEKGSSTEERPHRQSFLYERNGFVAEETDIAYLKKLASMYPSEMDNPRKYNGYNPGSFDLKNWLDKYNIRYREEGGPSRMKYVLDCCPFDESHKGKDAAIFQMSNGCIGFKCFHNSCSDKTWRDVRILFEPDAYEKKYKEQQKEFYGNFNRNKKPEKKIVPEEGKPIFYSAMDIFNMPKKQESFIRTGIDEIDKYMRGLKKEYVTVISGLRGASKSTILSQITLKAINDGNNVGIYSGELSPRNFMRWMNLQAAGKSNVEPSKFEGYYNVPRNTQERIAKWMDGHFYLYNNDYGNDYVAIIKEFEKEIEQKKLDLLILDNLMAFNISHLSDNKWDAQTQFVLSLERLAKKYEVAVIFVAHPRKAMGFLRLDDISGTGDLANAVDNAFIVHRINKDFKRLSAQMFGWKENNPLYEATNCIEIAKDRDGGIQDKFIPLWYEKETKRLKNSISENVIYGWDYNNSGFVQVEIEDENPFS